MLLQDRLEIPVNLQERLGNLGLDFLAEFLERVTQRQPANVDALAELGHVYTRLARHDEGLRVDRILAGLVPENPTVHYNLACSLALVGKTDDALDALELSVRLGYADGAFMATDEDLSNLRSETRFHDILRRIATPAPPSPDADGLFETY